MARSLAHMFALIAFLIFGSSRVLASVSQDGVWWSTLPRHDKLIAVEGAISGIENGWWLGVTTYDTKIELIVAHELGTRTGHPDDNIHFDREVALAYQQQKAASLAYSKHFSAYIDAIDDFYAKHPKASNVDIAAVMGCLSDKPWHTCDEIAQIFTAHPTQ